MNLNMPNKKGYTAIGLVELMLKHPSADRLCLDYHPGDRKIPVREIMVQMCPNVGPLLLEPLMERLDSSERNIKLLAALQLGKFEDFPTCLNGTNVKLWFDEPYHSYLL
jgi:hypothetical protein